MRRLALCTAVAVAAGMFLYVGLAGCEKKESKTEQRLGEMKCAECGHEMTKAKYEILSNTGKNLDFCSKQCFDKFAEERGLTINEKCPCGKAGKPAHMAMSKTVQMYCSDKCMKMATAP